MRPLPARTVALTLLLVLTACRGPLDPADDPSSNLLIGPTWVLEGFDSSNGNPREIPGDEAYEVRFLRDSTLEGVMACNTFSGTYTAAPDGGFLVRSVRFTEKACAHETLARPILTALGDARLFDISSGILVLTYGSRGALRFRRR